MADARFARINERTSNPNPHFKFISSLPGKADSDLALELMRALAAQVKVICKNHGMEATSFEEHEWNRVFAGRNWNAGEAIEIVLRRPNGKFFPAKWLIHVVLHELTHCHHMNHGPGFQKMLRGLEQEMATLHAKGYFGDGFWSSGSRLSDSALKMSNPLHDNKADYGEYLCGGAQQSKRPTSSKRNHRNNGIPLVNGVASTSSGAQTAKKHKPGARNLKAFEDKPSGNRLDGQKILTSEEKKELRKAQVEEKAREKEEKRLAARGLGVGERKPKIAGGGGAVGGDFAKTLLGTTGQRARSKKASEARADAAERRMKESKPVIDESASSEDSETEDEPEAERDDSATESEDDEPRRPLPESNDEIRDRLEKSRAAEGLNGKGKGAWREFVDLTKDDEEDGEATDWVMSDEEKQKVQTGDWKGKGKEKARARKPVVRFNSKTIDLETDSEEEDLGIDVHTSPKRPSAPSFVPKPILKKPSPPSKGNSSTKVDAKEGSVSPSPSRSTPPKSATPKASPPPKPSTLSSSSNGSKGNAESSSLSSTSRKVPPTQPQRPQPQPSRPSPSTSSKTSKAPPLPSSNLRARPAPTSGSSSSTNVRPPPPRPSSSSSNINRVPPSPPARPFFSAPAPPPASIQEVATQAFGNPSLVNLPPFVPPYVAARVQQSITDQLAAAGIQLPLSSISLQQPVRPPPPQQQQHQTIDDGQPWSCRICTFANNPLLQICELCEASKVAPPPPRVRGMFDRPSPPPEAAPPRRLARPLPPARPQSYPSSSSSSSAWSVSSFSSSSSGTHSYRNQGSGTPSGTFEGGGGGWTCWFCGQGGNDGERWACSTCFQIKKAS